MLMRISLNRRWWSFQSSDRRRVPRKTWDNTSRLGLQWKRCC